MGNSQSRNFPDLFLKYMTLNSDIIIMRIRQEGGIQIMILGLLVQNEVGSINGMEACRAHVNKCTLGNVHLQGYKATDSLAQSK